MSNSFLFGAAYATCATLMAQDYLGKSAYLQRVNQHWLDVYWGWWLVPMLLILCFEVVSSRRKK